MRIQLKTIIKSLGIWLINLPKEYLRLNWEAKIGILFLIPPIYGAIIFILNLLGSGIGFDSFPKSWNCIYRYDWYDSGAYGYAATPAIPLYLGYCRSIPY